MKKLLLFFLLVPLVSFGQTSTNIFFGIDLEKDWYTLSGLSGITYETYVLKNPSSPLIGVELDKSIYNLISLNLLEIGLNFQLFFETKQFSDNKTFFSNLSPNILLGELKFKSSDELWETGIDKFSDLFSMLSKKYGLPSQMDGDSEGGNEFITFAWERKTFKIILNLNGKRNKEFIQLMYQKL